MTKTETIAEFVGKTAFRATLIITCSYIGATLARADVQKDDTPVTGMMAPNFVLRPEYMDLKSDGELDDDGEEQQINPADKLEYEPVTDEKALLTERPSKAEQKAGVAYDAGADLIVSPEPDFALKAEAIEEKVPEAAVSPQPAPSVAPQN